MNPRFRLSIGDEPDYEDLIGEIYYDDGIVCLLTQEAGFDKMQIELFGPKRGGTWTFELAEFEAVLARLKQRLWELRRTEGPDS